MRERDRWSKQRVRYSSFGQEPLSHTDSSMCLVTASMSGSRPPRKASISSYPSTDRGNVQPSRLLTPFGPADSLLDCCGTMGPVLLAYAIDVYKNQLFLPIYAQRKDGRASRVCTSSIVSRAASLSRFKHSPLQRRRPGTLRSSPRQRCSDLDGRSERVRLGVLIGSTQVTCANLALLPRSARKMAAPSTAAHKG